MRTLLHIGINKTGTSTLQAWLGGNREALAAQGIAFPDLDGETHGHHPLAARIATVRGDRKALAAIRAEVETARRDHPLAILSSERFHTLQDVASVAAVFPPEETLVLVYLREPVTHLVSWYQQAVQSRPVAMRLEEFAALHVRSQAETLDRWVAVYGRQRVEVRLFERERLLGSDVAVDFASAVPGLDPERLAPAAPRNLSVAGNLLFLKRLVNLFLTEEEAREVAVETGAVARLSTRWHGRLAVGPEAAARLARLTAQDRAALRDRGVPVPDAPEEIPGLPSPDRDRLGEDLLALRAHLVRKERSILRGHVDRVAALLEGDAGQGRTPARATATDEAPRFLDAEIFAPEIRRIAEALPQEGARNQVLRHHDRLAASFASVPVARKGARLLDIGSKLELLPLFADRLAYEVSAAAYLPEGEPFADEVVVAGRRHPLLHFDLERSRAPLEPGSVDAVTLWEVIEHMARDPVFALANVNRALRPGGHLVISTVNCASLHSIRKILKGANPYLYPVFTLDGSTNRHNREYSARELLRLVEGAGFEVVRRQIGYFFSQEDRDLLARLERIGFPVRFPGDDTILLCRKVSDRLARAPAWLYGQGDDGVTMTAEEILDGGRIAPAPRDATPAREKRRSA